MEGQKKKKEEKTKRDKKWFGKKVILNRGFDDLLLKLQDHYICLSFFGNNELIFYTRTELIASMF